MFSEEYPEKKRVYIYIYYIYIYIYYIYILYYIYIYYIHLESRMAVFFLDGSRIWIIFPVWSFFAGRWPYLAVCNPYLFNKLLTKSRN